MKFKRILAMLLALVLSCAVAAAEAPTEAPDVLTEAIGAFAEVFIPTPVPTPAPTPTPEPFSLLNVLDTEKLAEEMNTVVNYTEPEKLSDEWWNILLLGTDNRYEESTYGRTDSMIILSVNTATKQAKLTSLMRDTWTPIPGHGKAKLNAATVYGGPELLMRTIQENFGIEINDYALINITGMADIIDILGGVYLDVTEDERKALNKGLFDLSSRSGMEKLQQSGENILLNGNQAVAFSRIRKIDSDYVRTERQRTVLTAVAERLKEAGVTGITGVVMNLKDFVETNLGFTDLMTLAYVGLQLDLSAIDQLRLPADGTYKSGTFDGVWCIKPDFDQNAAILKRFLQG